METLEIEKGGDIFFSLYLAPDTYKKHSIRGAITIENEEEIFINKTVSEKGAERVLVKRLEELKGLREKVEEIEMELEEIRKRFKSEENKQFEISPQILSKFLQSIPKFTKEEIESLINP